MKNTIVINSVTISDDIKEMERIIDNLAKLYNSQEQKLLRIPKDLNETLYLYIKSHRSNVTEGNTTSIGEFTQLVSERNKGNLGYVVPNKSYDETYEIDNLSKVYIYLKKIKNYNLKQLQNSHTILGRDILKNNLVEYRGKLKKINNFVPFSINNQKYKKYFFEPKYLKVKINKFFDNWNSIDDSDEGYIFAKYIVLQLELISIHPFNDGNGRISRAFAEAYIENFGYLAYTPYSTEFKKTYQEEIGRFSLLSLQDINVAYTEFAKYILRDYYSNIMKTLESVDKLESTKNLY